MSGVVKLHPTKDRGPAAQPRHQNADTTAMQRDSIHAQLISQRRESYPCCCLLSRFPATCWSPKCHRHGSRHTVHHHHQLTTSHTKPTHHSRTLGSTPGKVCDAIHKADRNRSHYSMTSMHSSTRLWRRNRGIMMAMQTVHQCLGVNADLTLASLCNLPAALLFAFKLVNDSDDFDTGPLEKISA